MYKIKVDTEKGVVELIKIHSRDCEILDMIQVEFDDKENDIERETKMINAVQMIKRGNDELNEWVTESRNGTKTDCFYLGKRK